MKKVLLLSTILIGLNVFSQVNLTSGLVAYYPYTGNANDAVGSAHGNILGTVNYATDRFNNPGAYEFSDGLIASSLFIPFFADFTVVLWFRTSNDETQKIFSWAGSNGQSGPNSISHDVTLRTSSTLTQLRRYINNSPNNFCLDSDAVNSSSDFTYNDWHMLVVKMNSVSQTMELFIDNVSLGTTALSDDCAYIGTSIGYSSLRIGGHFFEQCYAVIDDVMIYDRLINAAEMTALYELTEPFTLSAITVNSNSISAFSQTLGAASAEQSFTVSGSELTNNITVTAPTNYEVSLSSGSGFAGSVQVNQTSGLVPTTTIYVRLNAAAVGAYSGDITLTSGALSETVAVTGNTTQGTTGLNENNLTQLSIFPNPGSGMITLSVNQPTSAVFMSANGAILANLELDGETSIDVSTYAPGIYFIRTAEGQTVKFIKE